MANLKTYDPSAIAIVIAGRNLENLADTFVTISRAEDSYTTTVGADGEVTRNYNPNRTGTVVVTLKQSSDDNLFLSGLLAADELSKLGTFPVLIKDTNGNSLYTAAEAWVQKAADAEFAKEVGDREWTIACKELLMVSAGSF